MNTLYTGNKSPNPKGNKVKTTFSETLLYHLTIKNKKGPKRFGTFLEASFV